MNRIVNILASTLGFALLAGCVSENASMSPEPAVNRPAVGSENDLSSFQGARAGQAEGGIQRLGYEAVRTEGLTTYWYNRSTQACARITTSNGRYSSVNMIPAESGCVSGGASIPAVPTNGRPAVGSEYDLSSFEGARAGQAESGLQNLGYEAARTRGLTTWWYNRSTDACAKIVTSNGRYSSVTMVSANECR